MLIRPHDAALDDQEWRDLVSATPFGLLIAPGKDRELPVVVPTHVHFDGHQSIRLHLAKVNPVWPALAENSRCMFAVTAAVTYVPTAWEAEPGTAPEWGIPTSHYASVQLDCTASTTDDTDTIRAYLADQLSTMQPDDRYGDPRSADAPYEQSLRQIRGLALQIDHVTAKFKFDGGESDAVRQQVVDGYRRRAAPGDQAALEHLLRRHPPNREP
jgi:transcriptional regulator